MGFATTATAIYPPITRSASALRCFCSSCACCKVSRSEASLQAQSRTWSRPRPISDADYGQHRQHRRNRRSAAGLRRCYGDRHAREFRGGPDWAWRIPFLFGGIIAIAGYVLRHRLRDAGYTPKMSARTSLPLRAAIVEAPGAMLRAILFTSGYGIVNYLTMVFLPTYAATFGGVAEGQALQANTAAQALALFVVPLAAWLTDRAVRRRTLLIIAFAAEFVVAWSRIALAWRGGIAGVWTASLIRVPVGAHHGRRAGYAGRAVPQRFCLSAYSVSFNLGIGLAGGTAPWSTALIARQETVWHRHGIDARFCGRCRGGLSDGGPQWPTATMT